MFHFAPQTTATVCFVVVALLLAVDLTRGLLRANSPPVAAGAAAAPTSTTTTTAPPSLRINNNDTIDEAHMRTLIALAMRIHPDKPFAASLVDRATNKVMCTGVNGIGNEFVSPTDHGEINAITNCSRLYGFNYTAWTNYTLYTTAESCAMCQGAIEWARIGRAVYGTSIPFLTAHGWSQIDIRSSDIANRTLFTTTEVVGGVLEDECNALFLKPPKGGAVAHVHEHTHTHFAHDGASL